MRFANEFGFCDLNEFPGCSQLLVSNHAFVFQVHRGKGHGEENHRLRLRRARDLGYNAICCTVSAGNAVQKHILAKHKWTKVFSFNNDVSGHDVELWVKDLSDLDYAEHRKEIGYVD